MSILYIALGIGLGVFAALVTLLSGYGVLVAVAAYMIGGVFGIMAGVIWMLMPQRATPPKQTVTQQS